MPVEKDRQEGNPEIIILPLSSEYLYQHGKYQVKIGKGTSAALCLGWTEIDPELNKHPGLMEAALIGNLYSVGGVPVILRNLALHPEITELVVWDSAELSRTPKGRPGLDLLRRVWHGDFSELGPDFDPTVVHEIVSNVRLTEAGKETLESAEERSAALEEIATYLTAHTGTGPYREPFVFPDSGIAEQETLPSERVGWSVHGRTVADAWVQVLSLINSYATVKGTEYGLEQRELINVAWTVTDEDLANPYLPDWMGIKLEDLEVYNMIFLETRLPDGIAYTYGNRLGAHGPEEFNQIEEIIRHIGQDPNTRRANATTMLPTQDAGHESPPCLTQIQVIVTKGKVDLLADFRSHDIMGAAPANAFGLLALQAYIAERTGYERGVLSITSKSAHVYENRLAEMADIVNDQIRNVPVPLIFDEDTESDPRGNVIVRLEGEEIVLEMTTPDGQPIDFQVRGRSAKAVMREFAKDPRVSDMGHMGDIGIQLAWAEQCRDLGIEFHQDRKPNWRSL